MRDRGVTNEPMTTGGGGFSPRVGGFGENVRQFTPRLRLFFFPSLFLF